MDWGKIASDVTNWTDKVSAKINEAGDKAKEKMEEAKLRLQPPMTIGQYNIMLVKKIADGGFSEVFLARSADNPEEKFALKRMVCQNSAAKADAKAEMKLLKSFSQHPNVITVLGGSAKGITVPGQNYESMEVHMLFPLYDKGTAFDVMWSVVEAKQASGNSNNNGNGGFANGNGGGSFGGRGFGNDNQWPFPEMELASVLSGISLALIAMHKKGYAHRDIKPHNILIDNSSRRGGSQGILMDLGSAELACRDIETKKDAMKVEDDASIKCSAPYRAPELTQVQYPCSIDESVDVWSLGCTAYAMAFNAYSPFESEIEGVKRLAILNGKFIYPPQYRNMFGCVYSNNFIELLNRMITVDAKKRPTMTEVKNNLDCLMNGANLPPLVGKRAHGERGGGGASPPGDEGRGLSTNTGDLNGSNNQNALKTYLQTKEEQRPPQSRPPPTHQAPPPVAPTPVAPVAPAPSVVAPVAQPEPNLLDFDSFQAPVSQIANSFPSTPSNSVVTDDEFGDFEGAADFGDFVGAQTNQANLFDAAPQQQQQQQQQQPQPQQQPQAQQLQQEAQAQLNMDSSSDMTSLGQTYEFNSFNSLHPSQHAPTSPSQPSHDNMESKNDVGNNDSNGDDGGDSTQLLSMVSNQGGGLNRGDSRFSRDSMDSTVSFNLENNKQYSYVNHSVLKSEDDLIMEADIDFEEALKAYAQHSIPSALFICSRAVCVYKKIWQESLADTPPPERAHAAFMLFTDLLRLSGRLTDSEKNCKSLLKLEKKHRGMNHVLTADVLFTLGKIQLLLNKLDHSASALGESLKIQIAIDKDHVRCAFGFYYLALVFQVQENYTKAVPCFAEAVRMFKFSYGVKNSETAEALHGLSTVYYKLGDLEKAKESYFKTLTIKLAVYGKTHVSTADTMFNYSMVFRDLEEYPESLKFANKAYAILIEKYDDKHERMMETKEHINNLNNIISKEANDENISTLPPPHIVKNQKKEISSKTTNSKVGIKVENNENKKLDKKVSFTNSRLNHKPLSTNRSLTSEESKSVKTPSKLAKTPSKRYSASEASKSINSTTSVKTPSKLVKTPSKRSSSSEGRPKPKPLPKRSPMRNIK